MKIFSLLLLAAAGLVLGGCAAPQPTYIPSPKGGVTAVPHTPSARTGFQPRPPYLLNALADTADSAARHTSGPIAQQFRIHSTIFRVLTPQFWFGRQRSAPSYQSESFQPEFLTRDQQYLQNES